MQLSKRIFLSVPFILNPVFQANAEEGLPIIVVSASRSDQISVPYASNIKVITREDIELSGVKSLPDLLRGQPGVYVSDLFGDGSNASVDMRGFGSTANANTLIMVDGRKLNFATDTGTLYFNSIDLDNVEQVEITQGSSGVLFGNMAVGGVINVITRKPVDDVAELAVDIGSYNSHAERLRFENLFADGWSSRLVLNNRESDNYRDHNQAQTRSAAFRLDKRFDQGAVFAEYEYLDDYIQTPGALFVDEVEQDRRQSAGIYANDYQDLLNHLFRLGGRYAIDDVHSLEMDIGYQNSDREFISTYRSDPAPSVDITTQERKTRDINGRYIIAATNYQLTAGVDWQNTDYDFLSTIGPQVVDQSIASLYAQSVIKVNDKFDVIAGIRYAKVWNDLYTDDGFMLNDYSAALDDDVTVGSIGLNFKQNANIRWYAKIDQNYRFAKVEEHTNTVNYPGVGLKNQTGISYEAGAQVNHKNYLASVSLYQMDLNDEISFDSFGYANLNIDKTRRSGVSLSSEVFLNSLWSIGGNYDFVDSEITAGPNKNNQLPEVPEQRLRLFANFYPLPDLSMKLDGVYTGERYYGGDFSNTYEKMSSYTVFNVSGNYQVDNWSVTARINNLLDKKYSEYGAIGYDQFYMPKPAEFTAPQRNLWVGVKYSFEDY